MDSQSFTAKHRLICSSALSCPTHQSLSGIEASGSYDRVRKFLPNAPDGYTPNGGNCRLNRPAVRSAEILSPNETLWLEARQNKTVGAMCNLLVRLNISNFKAETYINSAKNVSDLSNTAIAASGGGYRAMLNGAGGLAAFDAHTDNATAPGQLGGLLQSSTYLSGLSGGSWLLGSIFVNNFTTIAALLSDDTGSVLEMGNSTLQGPASASNYYHQLVSAVNSERKADSAGVVHCHTSLSMLMRGAQRTHGHHWPCSQISWMGTRQCLL